MIQGDYRAAIDIGTTKVCVVLATRKADRRFEMLGMGVAPCDALRKGTVTDAPAITQAVRQAVAAASGKAGLTITRAYIGLAGTHIASESRWSHVPRRPGVRAVTDDDLAAALESAGRFDPTPGRQVLHVVPRSYTLDGVHGVRNPAGMHTGELHIQSQIISGAVEHIDALQNAVRAAAVTPGGMVVEPMATADAVLAADEREGVTVLVDIGGGKTDIAVFQDGVMLYTAVLPVGGYQFTNDLAIAFSLPYADAEKLKVENGTVTLDLMGQSPELIIRPAGMSGPITITQRELGQVLRDRAEEALEMLRLKLDVPELAELPTDSFVFTGGGAKLDGLVSLAKHLFQKKARLAVPRGMDGLPEANRDPSHSAALGMAIWAMRNLPPESHVVKPRQTAAGYSAVLSTLRGWVPAWGARGQGGKTAAKV